MKRLSQPYALSAGAVIVGVALLFAGRPMPWFGAAIIAGALAIAAQTGWDKILALRDHLERPRRVLGFEVVPLSLIYELLCVAAMVAIATAMLPEAALGDRPVNHDHAVHFFKAWQLRHDFLAHGRLWGWSHKWFAGYPAQYLYPIGADLWVNFVQLLSLGTLSLSQAYGVAYWLFWVLVGYSVYRFATVGYGRWVGLLAGILFMTDTASYRFGGFVYAAEWGVWPQSLSTVWAMLAMARVPKLMRGARWRDVGIFAFFLGISLLTHPIQLLHFAIAGPIILMAYWMSDARRNWPVASLRLIAGYVLGIFIGGLWLFPFLSVRDMAASYGEVWSTTFTMGVHLFKLDIFPGSLALVVGLGFLGSVALLWGRKFEHLLTALLVFAFLLSGSVTVLSDFHLLELSKAFQHVQFQRFSVMAKPYWFVAAGYAVVAIFGWAHRRVRERLDEHNIAPRSRGMLFLSVALPVFILMPFATGFIHEFGKTQVNRNLTEKSEEPDLQARDAVVAWFHEHYPKPEPFFRVMLKLQYHNHSFADLGTRIPFPLYKTGFTPASNYRYKMETDEPQLLDALNVRYAITPQHLPSSLYKLVKDFGSLRLYEYKRWKKNPFEVVDGQGDVTLERFDNEEIVLKAGPGSHGRLRLNVSNFPRWHATRDGQPVQISTMSLPGHDKTGFMAVALKPGTYRFVFRRSFVDWLSLVLFIVGMLGTLALCVAESRFQKAARVRELLAKLEARAGAWAERHRHRLDLAFGTSLAVLALVGMLLAWHTPRLDQSDDPGAPKIASVNYDFGDSLRHATVGVKRGGDFRPCEQVFDYFFCSNHEWNRVAQKAVDFEAGEIRRCIWAHPLKDAKLVIDFPDVPPGDALVGYYGVAKTGTASRRAPVEFTVGIDGIAKAQLQSDRAEKISHFNIPLDRNKDSREVSFEVHAKNVGRRHFCFEAQVVDLAK